MCCVRAVDEKGDRIFRVLRRSARLHCGSADGREVPSAPLYVQRSEPIHCLAHIAALEPLVRAAPVPPNPIP